MGSKRIERRRRVAEQVREALARALREDVRDPAVGFLTLTGVDLSPDLRHARVFVSTLTQDESRDAALAALNKSAPFLKRVLARTAGLRFVPALEFRFDPTLESGARIEALLRDVQPETDPPEEGASGDD